MRRENSDFQTLFLSEAGEQLENRDYFGFVELDDYACFVLADGIDECENKMSAKMVVEHVLEVFKSNPGNSKRHLNQYMKESHSILKKESTAFRLKASVLVVVTDYMAIRWANAGNVHMQVISGKDIRFSSRDQSYYQSQIEQGLYPEDRSEGFEERNNLTSYSGTVESFQPFISKKEKLKELDIILLSTVGFWEHISDIEILDAAEEAEEQKEFLDNLEEMLLSKQPEVLNNYTMASIYVNKLFLQEKKWGPLIKRVLIISIPILLILAIIGFSYYRSEKKKAAIVEEVEDYEAKGDEYVRDGNYARALEQYDEAVTLMKDHKKYENDPLKNKQKTSEYIVDGDSSAAKDELDDAKTYYTNARDMLIDYEKDLIDFDVSKLLGKLDTINMKIYIDDLIALGDTQLEAGMYEEAIDTYQKAKSSAASISDQERVQDADIKLENAKTEQVAKDQDEAAAEADKAAAEADQEAGFDPEEAADMYDNVADQYEKAGQSEKAAAMRAKAEQLRSDAAAEEKKRQETVAAGLADKGDKALAREEYYVAISFYESAQKIYMAIDSSSGIYAMTQKISGINNIIQAEKESKELQ